MLNYNTVEEIFNRNYGSEVLYKRPYCDYLLYTQGVNDFQTTLNACWVVDNVISYMLNVLREFKENQSDFFVVEITLNKSQSGYMEVFTEEYVDGEYNDHISIIKQDIPFIDLPTKDDTELTTYKFYLELASIQPLAFVLMLPREH